MTNIVRSVLTRSSKPTASPGAPVVDVYFCIEVEADVVVGTHGNSDSFIPDDKPTQSLMEPRGQQAKEVGHGDN